MPPLSRSQTIPSLHSWWSDRNTPGATVNLHALSKPLMRVFYHLQAREFIRINQGVRLSKDTMDIFLTYLHYKYVSVATRTLVMEELNTRAKAKSAEDFSVIVELLKRDAVLASLLQSPTSSVRTLTCDLLRNLTMQDDGDPKVRRSAMLALSGISQWGDGAEAVVDAKAHEHAMALLKSPDAGIRASTCYMLGNLASHERTWVKFKNGNEALASYNLTVIRISKSVDMPLLRWQTSVSGFKVLGLLWMLKRQNTLWPFYTPPMPRLSLKLRTSCHGFFTLFVMMAL
ncbi:hypothetical protein GGX14DRAFT_398870 [Mycena pura]|uniref:Uncharacterized protein n=1 Tax=Mycena pura TaxID=153505 RepID=A0AAD6V9K2_9AGAR|nr:hypothetical protein GGX14DRAFT_398870 [Mycena pura]